MAHRVGKRETDGSSVNIRDYPSDVIRYSFGAVFIIGWFRNGLSVVYMIFYRMSRLFARTSLCGLVQDAVTNTGSELRVLRARNM